MEYWYSCLLWSLVAAVERNFHLRPSCQLLSLFSDLWEAWVVSQDGGATGRDCDILSRDFHQLKRVASEGFGLRSMGQDGNH